MIKKVFRVLAPGMFSANLGMGIVMPLFPVYLQKVGASGFWIGVIMAAYGIASIISTPLFGRLSGRKGRKFLLCLGLASYTLISVGYIFCHDLPSLIIIRFLHGLAGGMVMPIAVAYMGDVAPQGEEGKWMGYSNAVFYGGFGAGPLLGGAMSQYLGMTVTFSVMAGLNLSGLIIFLFFLPRVDPKPRYSAIGARPAMKVISRSNMVRGIFSYQLAQSFGQAGFMTFIPIFATGMGLSLSLVGILIAITMCLMSFLAPFTGRLADRFNKRGLIVIGCCVIALALVMIPWTSSFWQLLCLAAIMATGAGLASPSASALAVDEGRKFGMGSTIGLVNTGTNIGFAVGPILAGKVGDLRDTRFAFYFGGLMVVLFMIPFTWYTRTQSKLAAGEEPELLLK
jgi:MFS transporter, DHA1 family, multidrug resistance protein